ncbi:MAG: creatininase family protein [Planctomycetaceae bacterium]
MTAPQLAQVARDRVLAIVPIAALEQHGPHMPAGTDTIICTAIAEALEQLQPMNILLTPTLWLGASAHHLRFGATLTANLDTYIATLCEVVESLLKDGYKRILLLNGHGGNVDPLKVALRQLQPKYPESLLVGGSYWSGANDLLHEALEGGHKYVGHACEFETSLLMHLRPELVDHDKRANAGELVTDQIDGLFVSRDMMQRTALGSTGRPDLASSEKGAILFKGLVQRLATTIEQLLVEPIGIKYSDFVGESV